MGCCFSTAKWKRTEVVDHKWDYVDLNEFKDDSILAAIGYAGVFLITFRSVLTYMAEISTAILITQFNTWSFVSPTELANDNKIVTYLGISPSTFAQIVPFISLIYLGSIFVSFLLLAFDSRKSKRIIQSRDISFSFTDVISYRYYCLRSFPHWCFFRAIRARHSFSSQLAFFIFFRLKDWKRLLFAETPRHLVNLLFLSYHVISVGSRDDGRWSYNDFITKQFGSRDIRTTLTSQMSVLVMAFVFAMYAINVMSTIVAGITYVPLLCKIRGNLKEYVCHMIDKRIAELMLNKATKRINKQQQELALYGTTKDDVLNGGPEAKLPVLADTDLSSYPPSIYPVTQHSTGSRHFSNYPPTTNQYQHYPGPAPETNSFIYTQSTGTKYPPSTTVASIYPTNATGPVYPQSTGSSGNISTHGFSQRNGNRY